VHSTIFATSGRPPIEEAARFVLSQAPVRPTIGIVLGSGLGDVAAAIPNPVTLAYQTIPHYAPTTVEGHRGELVLGQLEGKPVAVMNGRLHLYEGYSPQQVTFPIRVLRAIGVETLILTNASGGLNPRFRTGSLMLIRDHINLPGMAGQNPLVGPNDPSLGTRFPAMDDAYDPGLRRLAHDVARSLGFTLHEGVYVMVAGPSFETPAEIAFLRLIGADAVGMSTVGEAVVARHGGMRVLGIAMISNEIPLPVADRDPVHSPEHPPDHQEVLAAGRDATPRMVALIRGIVKNLP